jgi:hypothetical protein
MEIELDTGEINGHLHGLRRNQRRSYSTRSQAMD